MLLVPLILCLSAASHALGDAKGYEEKDVVRTVTPLGAIRGSWMETRRGRKIEGYRGVRYAQPPVGELRFQPAQPITKYSEEVNATGEGPACPMPVEEGYYIDEDCLRLNVYTPNSKSSNKLPVIFFIHPGAYYSFSGRSDVFGPENLLDRDLVLVTTNYRLGSLGFMSTGDKFAPGNNGFKDQVVALRWVQKNIAAFGGDPSRVTIAGCSVGAFSVMLHMVSPMSKGLFNAAISMSGSPISKGPLRQEYKELAIRQANVLNCSANDSRAIIDCLKTKPFKEIGDSLDSLFEFGYDPMILWDAVVERDFGQERFLTEQPLDSIRRGHFHPVRFMISQTRNEFFWKAFSILNNATLLKQMNENFEEIAPISFLLPENNKTEAARYLKEKYLNGKIANDTATAKGLGRLYGDAIIGFPVHRLANLMCRNSHYPVYYYEFDYIGNHSFYENDEGKPTEVAHHDDLLYLFGIKALFPIIPPDNSADSLMVDKMTALWYNFAKYGNPNDPQSPELKGLAWPAMDPEKREYLKISDRFFVQEGLFENWFKIWEHLYPISYGPEGHSPKTQKV